MQCAYRTLCAAYKDIIPSYVQTSGSVHIARSAVRVCGLIYSGFSRDFDLTGIRSNFMGRPNKIRQRALRAFNSASPCSALLFFFALFRVSMHPRACAAPKHTVIAILIQILSSTIFLSRFLFIRKHTVESSAADLNQSIR